MANKSKRELLQLYNYYNLTYVVTFSNGKILAKILWRKLPMGKRTSYKSVGETIEV